MKTIWKFPLEITNTNKINIPKNFNILSVKNQGNTLVLYVLVDSAADGHEEVEINIYGTGNPVPQWPGHYLDTVINPW